MRKKSPIEEYRVSPATRIDLSGIWDYTAEMWSSDQADTYLRGLDEKLEDLCRHPEISRDHRIFHAAVLSVAWLRTPRSWHIAMPSGEGGNHTIYPLQARLSLDVLCKRDLNPRPLPPNPRPRSRSLGRHRRRSPPGCCAPR
ncbi:type II toxin-antitoxin system RelE/ParE family toxin [Roseivivax sediminis]|uniref:type II toxin-antitoxin system RelE/ParE family toxin n=1 Tax=Roseivivax sediminis TaxID=936889 RepID=UPI00122CEBAD